MLYIDIHTYIYIYIYYTIRIYIFIYLYTHHNIYGVYMYTYDYMMYSYVCVYIIVYISDKLDDIWKKWHVIYDMNTLKKVWTREWLSILLPMENMSHFDPFWHTPTVCPRVHFPWNPHSNPCHDRYLSPVWLVIQIILHRVKSLFFWYVVRYQKPSETIRNHQKPSETNRNQQKPSETIRNHQKPSETNRNHQKPSETIRNHQKPSETIRNHQKPSETNRNHQKPTETIRNHQKPSETNRNHQKPSETIRNHQKPSETIRNHQKPKLSTLPGKVFKEASPEVVRYRLGIWEGPIEAERWVFGFLDENGYGSIPINTIFSGMTIHFNPAILMWTTGILLVLTHCQINSNHLKLRMLRASMILFWQDKSSGGLMFVRQWDGIDEARLYLLANGGVVLRSLRYWWNLSTPKWSHLPINLTNRFFVS